MNSRLTLSTLVGLACVAFALPASALALLSDPPAPICAAGTVGSTVGGPFDVLSVNATSGGIARSVTVDVGAAFSISVSPPPVQPFSVPNAFVIWGRVGGLGDDVGLATPMGSLCIRPEPMFADDATLFTVANSLGADELAAFAATPAPWTGVVPAGIPGDVVFTLQGVIIDTNSPLFFSLTNALEVRVEF